MCALWPLFRLMDGQTEESHQHPGKCNSSVTHAHAHSFGWRRRRASELEIERIGRTAQNICRFIHYMARKTRVREGGVTAAAIYRAVRERAYKIEKIPTTTITVTKDSYTGGLFWDLSEDERNSSVDPFR